jgi:hypothetical protein
VCQTGGGRCKPPPRRRRICASSGGRIALSEAEEGVSRRGFGLGGRWCG